MSWADIVSQYQHHGRTWADLAEEDDEAVVDESQADTSAAQVHKSYASAVCSSLPANVRTSTVPQEVESHASAAIPQKTVKQHERPSRHSPQDPVGIQAVQSILMSATQKSLSHFHTAGMAGYVHARQEPSAADAMDSTYTINNTSMTFESYLDVYTLRKQLVGTSLSSFVRTVGSSLTGLPEKESIWYLGKKMYDGSLLRIYVDYNKMRDHGLTLKDLARETFKGATTNVSPDFMGMIDVEIPDVYLSPWLSAMNENVFGTPDILSCDICLQAATAKITNILGKPDVLPCPANVALTRGTDILAVSRVQGVNVRTITSNNVSNVEAHFGVEAAASVLHSLTKSHIVSDFMARTGRVLSFTKNSKEVTNKGLLTSMGFERPKYDIKNTINATFTGAGTLSVYESIITGIDPPCNFAVRI